MKKIIFFCIALLFLQQAHAQQIGINTTNPDVSAILDINSSNKGILIPQVFVNGIYDYLTVASPATSLLLYNTNPNMPSGKGFYFNTGTPVDPLWTNLKTDPFNLPFCDTVETAEDAFSVSNIGSGNALKVNGKISIKNTGEKMGKTLMISSSTGDVSWEGAIAFSAYDIGNSNLVVPGNTDIKVPFNLENYDMGSSFVTAGSIIHPSTFVAPKYAIYHFDATILWSGFSGNSNNDFGALTIWMNNYQYLTDRRSAGTVPFTCHLSADIALFAGDIVFLSAYHNNAAPQSISNATAGNRFSGRFISTY